MPDPISISETLKKLALDSSSRLDGIRSTLNSSSRLDNIRGNLDSSSRIDNIRGNLNSSTRLDGIRGNLNYPPRRQHSFQTQTYQPPVTPPGPAPAAPKPAAATTPRPAPVPPAKPKTSPFNTPQYRAYLEANPEAKAKFNEYVARGFITPEGEQIPQHQRPMNPTNTQPQPAGQPIQPTAQLNKASEETTLKAIRKQLKSLNSENNIKVSHEYIEHITSSVENFQEAFQKEAQAAWDGMVTSMKKEGATADFILGMTKEAEEYFQNIKTADLGGNTALSLTPQAPGTFPDGLLQNHANRIPAPATSLDLSAPATWQNPQNPIPLFSDRQSPDFIRDKYVGPPPRPQGLYLDTLLQESSPAPVGAVVPQGAAQQPSPTPAPAVRPTARGPLVYPAKRLPPLPTNPEFHPKHVTLGHDLYNKANSLSRPVDLSSQFFPGSENTPENYQIKGNNILNNPGAQNSLASKRMDALEKRHASLQAKANPTVANNPSQPTAGNPNTSTPPPTTQSGGLNPFASLSSGSQHAMGGIGGMLMSMLIGNALGLEGPMAWMLPMLGGVTGYNFFPDLMKTINPN
jgi:hypothetical protein